MTAHGPPALDREGLFAALDAYYAPRLAEHGASARGVDWNSSESQELRFRQLLRVREDEATCSLVDYGCGYGELAHLLVAQGETVDYRGFDVSERMIDLACVHNPDPAVCRFTHRLSDVEQADYLVASGVFNLRLDVDEATWEAYVLETLDTLAGLGRRGFAFNLLTSWSDADRMRPDLFYADPAKFFDHCKREYSRHVALLHDYGLYEWTMLVRTDA
ncbi:MAG: class I SAM-dependent methyltransferase [Thermoleophilaceae bacterium]|nr:class I SAM-dependent methyltransferase [Thermoleophilaceae bacterium]